MTVFGFHPNAKIKNNGIKYFLLLNIFLVKLLFIGSLFVINSFFNRKKYNNIEKVYVILIHLPQSYPNIKSKIEGEYKIKKTV